MKMQDYFMPRDCTDSVQGLSFLSFWRKAVRGYPTKWYL